MKKKYLNLIINLGEDYRPCNICFLNTDFRFMYYQGEIAEGEENLMPHLIASFESYATIGEVCQVLREIWGEYEENVTL